MDIQGDYAYVGGELELFLNAVNWKKYWSSCLQPFVHGSVLDVGAGLGATFDYLNDRAQRWTCLEPDPALCKRLEKRLSSHARPPRVLCGTIDDVPQEERFDTIVYIDVLEHIEQDGLQLQTAAARLHSGGSLIVLSPALPFLYSPFDQAVGHFRRYTRESLARATPETLSIKSWFFLDGLGVLASLFARVAKRSAPTPSQIEAWDTAIVPVSRVTDQLTSRLFGRTLVMVWTKK